MDKISHHRRRILALGAAAIGLSLFPDVVSAAVSSGSSKASRTLNIKALNTNETIKSTYFVNGQYDQNELKRLNHLLRDFRSGESHPIDPKLYDQLYALNKKFGLDKQILLICGYRSPVTNATLRSASTGVAEKSLHMVGQAIDFRIEGVSLKDLLNAAMDMNKGGVGYYPKSNFVHIDTGVVRSWPASSISVVRVKPKAKTPAVTSTATASSNTARIRRLEP